MAERWTEIRQVDENIHANRLGYKRTEGEIAFLQSKLENYDRELSSLRSHKQFLGKEIYGSPHTRSELVEKGMSSSNFRIREAAQKLKEQDSNIKWDITVKEELINICVYIDSGVTKIKNWNISSILYKIGKLGYEEIENFQGAKNDI